MPTLPFTVDSQLLAELGERLVGKPHIALAELIKNAYDADATEVKVEFDPGSDRIAVIDNGNGMSLQEFRDFWMRVGSTHKVRQRVSRKLKRPLTGSKGVGRLAVQYLGKELEVRTIARSKGSEELIARIDWEKAVSAGDLTEAKVEYSLNTSAAANPGTHIIMTGLKHKWDSDSLMDLAKEVWWLRPPFRAPEAAAEAFDVKLVSPKADYAKAFDSQLGAVLSIWDVLIAGQNDRGHVNMGLVFRDEPIIVRKFDIPECELKGGDFQIRFFKLMYRQPFGIKVEDARGYFEKYGGVHIYDAGFHLPFYGNPQNDWLRIQYEHSMRRSRSEYLPEELQFPEGLNFLPTLSRVFGVVNVNTAQEPGLDMMVTRDRLNEGSKAFENLRVMVRYATDFYAMEMAKRAFEARKADAPIVPITKEVERVEDVLEKYRPDIPKPVYQNLRTGVSHALLAARRHEEAGEARVGLLAPLATAGITSLAYQHELQKQFSVVERVLNDLKDVGACNPAVREALAAIREDLRGWVKRARATNSLFAYMADEENRERRARFRARSVVTEVARQVDFFRNGAAVDKDDMPKDLLLPPGTMAQWGAIFQNVFINAFNAMAESSKKRIVVSTRARMGRHEVLVQDTGHGLDLKDREDVFRPFERRSKISREMQAAGFGGTGLGLTIVRIVAGDIGCTASFVDPEKGFSTAFRLAWQESE